MNALSSHFELANGIHIPQLGFGTWQIPDGADAYDAVAAALAAGYRHIDTARAYGNEQIVGRAIAESGIARDELFVTTKLPAEIKSFEGAKASFEESISLLALDYVDLYLIHAPWPWQNIGSDHAAGNIEAWRAMEEIYGAGRSKAIGVSNFAVADLESLIGATEVVPHANQIKYFIGNTQEEIVAWCRAHNVLVEGYSPLATGAILENPDVAGIAGTYDKTVAQLCIRYVLQQNVLPLPKTTNAGRMAENADVDFEISADDMTFLDGLRDTTDAQR